MLSKLKSNYNMTIYASFIGYITQAISINFAPLLFVTFQKDYNVSLGNLSSLIFLTFFLQLIVDFFSVYIIKAFGYRKCVVTAHILCTLGLLMLSTLPDVFDNGFLGILIATVVYSVGSGLIEVLISAIVEACPTKKKASAMSLLHSFYCWGFLGVVLLSTLFFNVFGLNNWKILSALWALVPFVNIFLFALVPITTLETVKTGYTIKQLLKMKTFWYMLLLMLCAGAGEQAISQWISAYAEEGLNVSKTFGDLLGASGFALLMGISRVIYAKSKNLSLKGYMNFSAVMLVVSYLIIAFAPVPVIGLIGCCMAGFFCGIMWPGTYSLASGKIKGGTAMFALLALAGDVGCSVGPALVGTASETFSGNLSTGIAVAIIFPLVMLIGLLCDRKK